MLVFFFINIIYYCKQTFLLNSKNGLTVSSYILLYFVSTSPDSKSLGVRFVL